jgi:hypothetical protein
MTMLEIWLLITLWLCTLAFAYMVGRRHGEYSGYVTGLCFRSSELDDE